MRKSAAKAETPLAKQMSRSRNAGSPQWERIMKDRLARLDLLDRFVEVVDEYEREFSKEVDVMVAEE